MPLYLPAHKLKAHVKYSNQSQSGRRGGVQGEGVQCKQPRDHAIYLLGTATDWTWLAYHVHLRKEEKQAWLAAKAVLQGPGAAPNPYLTLRKLV